MKSGAVTVAIDKSELEDTGAPPELVADLAEPPPDEPKTKAKPAPAPPPEPKSTIMRQIEADEEKSLKEWLDGIGTQGAFRASLHRTEPKYVTVRGRGQVKCDGFLANYEHAISEEDIQRQWGGGSFSLQIKRPGKNGNSMVYQRGLHRTLQIAGDPSTDNLPGGANTSSADLPPASQQPAENASVTKELTSLVKDMVRERDHGDRREPRGIDPAMQILLEQNTAQLAARERELSTLRSEMNEIRKTSAVTPSDPIKDQMLSSMISGRDGQVEAIRVRTESELRQAKEGHLQEVQRLEDRHDREVSAMRGSNDRALSDMKASYEREISAMRSAHEVALSSVKATFDVQVHTLNAEVKRFERDIEELRRDNRELRERKEKGIIEQLTEMEKIKEAFGGGDEASGTWDKITAALPAVIEQAGKIMASKGAPATPQVQAVAAPVQRPQIFKDRSGQRVVLQGGQMVPVVRKPRVVQKDDGTPIAAPVVEPNQVTMLVAYLESAFKGGQDPDIVAQSGRASVPDEVLKWIRENDSDQVSGVDLFMRRVANLSSSSPLSTQSGRNWLRKVGKALVGDEPGGE